MASFKKLSAKIWLVLFTTQFPSQHEMPKDIIEQALDKFNKSGDNPRLLQQAWMEILPSINLMYWCQVYDEKIFYCPDQLRAELIYIRDRCVADFNNIPAHMIIKDFADQVALLSLVIANTFYHCSQKNPVFIDTFLSQLNSVKRFITHNNLKNSKSEAAYHYLRVCYESECCENLTESLLRDDKLLENTSSLHNYSDWRARENIKIKIDESKVQLARVMESAVEHANTAVGIHKRIGSELNDPKNIQFRYMVFLLAKVQLQQAAVFKQIKGSLTPDAHVFCIKAADALDLLTDDVLKAGSSKNDLVLVTKREHIRKSLNELLDSAGCAIKQLPRARL